MADELNKADELDKRLSDLQQGAQKGMKPVNRE